MAAYLIANVTITDPARYPEYARQVPATLGAYGGRYLARGGTVEVLEGDWSPSRLVIIEFASLERAKAWYDSPEYAPVKQIRLETATTEVVFVDGLPPAAG